MKRHDLYEAIWERPIIHVAAQVGISDKGLKGVCVKWNIPTPGRGYWRQLHTGQKPQRTPLPEEPGNPEIPLFVKGGAVLPSRSVPEPEVVPGAIETAKESADKSAQVVDPFFRTNSALEAEYARVSVLAEQFDVHERFERFLNAVAQADGAQVLPGGHITRQWLCQMRRAHARNSPVAALLASHANDSAKSRPPPWWGPNPLQGS